ncbi:MAG: MBL fold metallo-hydrolase [bacterium]
MELIILGSGTAALQHERGPSGYLLRVDGETCLIDGGTGALLNALRAGISYKEIDKLFYTHLHPDHTIDLIPFLFASKNTPGFARTQMLHIFGPVGFAAFYDKLLDVYGRSMVEVAYDIEITELAESNIALRSFGLQSGLMRHSQHAIGYRFEQTGKVLVYSGDTDMCDDIVELARDADVLVLECSFDDDHKTAGHLTPTEAGRIASAAGVKHLILTHLYPPFDEVQVLTAVGKQFGGKASIARDLMQVRI